MAEIAREFEESNGRNILHRLPQVADQRTVSSDSPWHTVREGELPPMMFQLRFRDGHMESYSYNDVREVHCRDAGLVTVFVHSMRKKAITIEGRHLKELANLFCIASLRSVHEADERAIGRPESSPEITRISVKEIVQK